jgi:hypothetical protein
MDFSGTKHIVTLSDSDFYRKIVKKYQTRKKNTFGFPTMIFYKGKNSVSPKKFDIIFKFNFHLNQQRILPLLILKNDPNLEETLLRLKTEIKVLQSMIMLKEVKSNNCVKKLSLTALKISHGRCTASEHFLTGSTYNYNTTVSSFFGSIISRSGIETNNLAKKLILGLTTEKNSLETIKNQKGFGQNQSFFLLKMPLQTKFCFFRF